MNRKILIILFASLLLFKCTTKSKVLNSKELNHYPSGSAIEYLDKKLYLVGDDAPYMVGLNEAFEVQDSINLINTKFLRIPKNEKPDFESSTTMLISGEPFLLVLGSGSLDTIRNKGLLINVKTKQKVEFRLDTFYNRIHSAGIKALNIEGLCKTKNGFIIGNRGNTSYSENHLVIAADSFWNYQALSKFKIIPLESDSMVKYFSGLSGLDYSEKKDMLIMSISTENTSNAYDDGEIGKSYLWIVKNFSSNANRKMIKADTIIDLIEVDNAFNGHKIESVCIISEKNDELELALVADDDKGSSLLFRIRLTRI